MFASPFFTSGRSAILPTIANKEELHTANSLTQTTQWMTLTIGAFLGGTSITQFGYKWAFTFNALSFLFSAACISRLRVERGGFRAERTALTEDKVVRPWHEYTEGLRYMRASPLILGIALVGGRMGVGRRRRANPVQPVRRAGIQSRAGGHRLSVGRGRRGIAGRAERSRTGSGKRISFGAYKRTISICYVIHGGAYVIFSQMRDFQMALLFLGDLALGHRGQLRAQHVATAAARLERISRPRVCDHGDDAWSTMMLSMAGAGVASESWSPRTIGVVSGLLSSSTAFFWLWANWTGRLPEPAREGVEPEEIEVHGDPVV